MTVINEALWRQIGNENISEGLFATRLLPLSSQNLFAAQDTSNGTRYLILKTERRQRSRKLPAGRGFSVSATGPHNDVDGKYRLVFALDDRAFSDFFNVIATDVVEEISDATTETEAYNRFVDRVLSWQQFLDKRQDGLLSEQAQLGLLGELQFLGVAALESLAHDKGVESWTGPDALHKDFQFPAAAVEVKTTLSKNPIKVHISSEIQLETNDSRELFLYVLAFEKTDGGGVSLPSLVAQISSTLADDDGAKHRFARKLLQAGYRVQDQDRYAQSYALRRTEILRVAGDFPRIRGSELPRGVGDITYSIVVDACLEFRVSMEDLSHAIRRSS